VEKNLLAADFTVSAIELKVLKTPSHPLSRVRQRKSFNLTQKVGF
jgi:hypothetical protein